MTQANLSETLFKPRFKHPETSTLFVASTLALSLLCSPLWTAKTCRTGIA